ncbi:zinc-binding dehydrogenase, partial [Rhizobium sp. Root1204]|uniref:zinc-binding dehydrogenase n=1 Tax=Rhizobium sp. Root1204 TaxID=1736428 RepID=UPI0012E3B335
VAAIFDPFGNAVHTALSFDLVGEDVLVTGAGPIGIMGAMVAKRSGARKVVITDINPVRLALAEKMGIDYVVDASKENLADVMKRIGMTEGFDVGLEMSGAAPAFRDMIDKMNNGGKIAILGIAPTGFEIDWNKVIFKMLNLKGIYGREMFETWYKMIAFVQGGLDLSPIITHRIGIDDFREMFETWYKMIAFVQGGLDLSPIITHRIGIDDFREGFEAMRSGNSGKVVMDW